MMQKVFDTLRELQEVLSEKYALQHEIDELPKVLEKKTEMLNSMKVSYLAMNEQLKEITEKIESFKKRLQEASVQREEAEKKMDHVTTQREYEAIDKEIKSAMEEEQKIRVALQHEEQRKQDLNEKLESDEEVIKLQETEISEETELLNNQLSERTESMQALIERESALAPDIEENILYKFKRITKSKSGVGIVSIKGAECTGCHMILPQDFVNKVRQGEEFLFCPYCSRILYYTEQQDAAQVETDDEGIEAGALADFVDVSELGL